MEALGRDKRALLVHPPNVFDLSIFADAEKHRVLRLHEDDLPSRQRAVAGPAERMARTPAAQKYEADARSEVVFGLNLGLSAGDRFGQGIAESVVADVAIGAKSISGPSSKPVDHLNYVNVSPRAQSLDMFPAKSALAKPADWSNHPSETAGFDDLGMHQQQLAAQCVLLPADDRSVDQVAANGRR